MTRHEHIRILKRFSLVGRAGETREQMAKAPSRCQPRDRPEHFHYYLRCPQYTVHVHVSWYSCVYVGMACTDTHEQSGDQQSTHSRQRRPASAELYDTKELSLCARARSPRIINYKTASASPASPSPRALRALLEQVIGRNASQAKKNADQGNRISDDFR